MDPNPLGENNITKIDNKKNVTTVKIILIRRCSHFKLIACELEMVILGDLKFSAKAFISCQISCSGPWIVKMGLILPSRLSLVGVLLLCSTGLPLEGWAGPMGGVGEGLQRVDPSIDCWTLL